MFMKKIQLIFILPILMMMSCGYSTEEIKNESLPTVTSSISETLDISEQNLEVLNYTLVQESDSKYSGILKTEYDGYTQTFDVEVLWDHSTDEYTVEWELVSEN
jgi:hypothetical protein